MDKKHQMGHFLLGVVTNYKFSTDLTLKVDLTEFLDGVKWSNLVESEY